MFNSRRSTKGCWTCRLRRKKCDEGSPACSICTSLALTCHGYGSRPEWMDGKAREQEIAAGIRDIVKATTSQKKRIAMLRRSQSSHPASNGPGSEGSGTAHPLSPPQSASTTVISPALTNSSEGSNIHISDLKSPGPSPGSSQVGLPFEVDDDEASLLMHYLDYVFPLQFRFYQPSMGNGGRGWLLSTLMQTPPLYHAALSLAAYHRQYSFCQGVTDVKRRCFQLEALQEQHVLAIGLLRQYLESSSMGTRCKSLVDNIKILCCMALMISLEVFIDGTESWRIHMRAASALISDLKSDDMMRARRELSTPNEAALFFFAGVISWYDILSCATTGSKPFSQFDCPSAGEGFLHFDQIMGCENWAMLCIRDIAKLDEWKNEMQRSGNLSMRELVSRAMDIESRLEHGLDTGFEKPGTVHCISSQSNTGRKDAPRLVHMVTQAFACSALVYLHVVVSGPRPGLSEIQQSVTRTIAALQAFPDQDMLSILAWPLCIAGCMASEEQKEIFRSFATLERVGVLTFGNSTKVLAIMERCWTIRKQEEETGLVDWRSAMTSLSVDILLV